MGYIFISYGHKDKDYVHRLQEALQNEGFDVWIDDRIDYGDEWPIVIQEKLDACDAFILVATENSFKSKWVQKEVTRAQRINKPFFPLLLSGETWLSIESTQHVDVKDQELPPTKFFEGLAHVTPRRKESILYSPEQLLTQQEKVISEQERKYLMELMKYDEKGKLVEALLNDYWERLGNLLDAYSYNGAPSSEIEKIEKYVEKMAEPLGIPEPPQIEEHRYRVLLAKLDGSYKVAEAMIANEQRRYQNLTRKEAVEKIIKRIERYKQ
jgi:hypothetical protein